MFGRFTQIKSWAEIHRLYSLTDDAFIKRNDMPARYNIALTQNVPIVHNDKDDKRDCRGSALVARGLVGQGNARGGGEFGEAKVLYQKGELPDLE